MNYGKVIGIYFLFFFISYSNVHAKEMVTTCAEMANGEIICTEEPMRDPKVGDPIRKPETEEFIEETVLKHIGDYLDENETAEMLIPYVVEMRKAVGQSFKKRMSDEKVDCEPIEECLKESEKRLLSAKEKYPESRHISEGLGRVYKELYEHTDDEHYLEKALDAFIYAEEMGIKHGGINAMRSRYGDPVVYISSIIDVHEKVDKYFSMVLKAFPDDSFTNLYYAKVLSRTGDDRTDEFYKKAMSLEPDDPFDSAIEYAEYLLSGEKYKDALSVLNKVRLDSDKIDFLKGFAFEKLGKRNEAKREYDKYRKKRKESGFLNRFDKPDVKYKIPGSTLQKGIEFEAALGDVIILADKRTTPCASADWACKSYWYGVWTLDGEARTGTIGMHRAVAWNIRTRVFGGKGEIICLGVTGVCFNYASQYPLTWGDVTSLNKRYFYVIETGGYAGLTLYSTPTQYAIDAWKAVYNGQVPDPIRQKCLYGSVTPLYSGTCETACTSSGLWGSFSSYASGVEFRAGKVEYVSNFLGWCYSFAPTSIPSGSYCGKNCFVLKDVVCPVMKAYRCYNGGTGPYYVTIPSFGNFFWRFNL